MDVIVANIHWIMLVGGVITITMLAAAVAPRAIFRSMVADEPQGPLALLLARNWGVLIALTGAMLLWGAYHPEVRSLVLAVAATSKLVFISLLASHAPYRRKAIVPIVVDGLLSLLFIAYLLAA